MIKSKGRKNGLGRKKKTHEEFVKEVYGLVGNEYSVISNYANAREKIHMRHNICGSEYEVLPNAFTSKGVRCPKCSNVKGGEKKRKTHKEYVQQVKEKCGEEYLILGEYKKGDEKILIEHSKCGYQWEVTAHSFLNKPRCPKCLGYIKKTHEMFVQEVASLNGDEYSVLSEYINNKTKVKIQHNVCGAVFEVVPIAFLRGKRCPECGKKSKRGIYV